MVLTTWRRFIERKLSSPRRTDHRRPRSHRLHCESLEPRCTPSAYSFSTGIPDGRAATISEPPNAHNSQIEFESADDFVVPPLGAVITNAAFTGLLTGGATLDDVSNVFITIYRVFPNDSDVTRTSGPPDFSTSQVPTRVNSPADNEIENRDSAAGDLTFLVKVGDTDFSVDNSVSTADAIALNSGGNGSVSGEEVTFGVTFQVPLDLAGGHYFFVPKVGLTDGAPAEAHFLWLSAAKPIVPPGEPFTPDLQSWMRDDPGLAPDWLRIGTDIIGGATFNASFHLSGTVNPKPPLELTPFDFSTGDTDGRIATISEPANAHNSQVEYESADDFLLPSRTIITEATFTGLLTGGVSPKLISNVVVEVYRVFPQDSDVARTSGPPDFSTGQVPTRVNSPSDVAFQSRDSADGGLAFTVESVSASFTADNSVSTADAISVASGGNGPATGEEVVFHVRLRVPFDLPADHYFFVPQVGFSDGAPEGADFLWLSAPKPIVPPGTPFTPDLQSWMRDDPPLAPDWLRVGTDIIGGTTFNSTFSLTGTARNI